MPSLEFFLRNEPGGPPVPGTTRTYWIPEGFTMDDYYPHYEDWMGDLVGGPEGDRGRRLEHLQARLSKELGGAVWTAARVVRALLLAVGLAVAVPVAAEAQPRPVPCHDYVDMAELLAKRYKERPVAFGMQSNGNLLQVWASTPDDPTKLSTWTIISLTPRGRSCIIAAGKGWETLPDPGDKPFA